MALELTMNLQQRQKLTQQMELSVRILQMDALNLTEYLKEMMLENPVMEMEAPDLSGDDHREELALRKMQWLESQTRREKENVGYYENDGNPLEKIAGVCDEISLTDHLLGQLKLSGCEQRLLAAAQLVIGCLDDNGYLQESLEELEQRDSIPAGDLERALRVVQGFDPAGVGARNLAECLLLQLEPEDRIAREIVSRYLGDLAKNRHTAMAKALGVTVEDIRAAVARIQQLTPKPGSVFRSGEVFQYITPDVVVTSFQDRYNVMLCDFAYPDIRMNSGYLELAKQSDDREVTAYLNEKVNQVNWIKKCIQSRNETLSAVSRAIVRQQENFFRYGPQHLRILRMRDVAEMVGMHESTVSRAVRDKYLQCSHGVYPLRHFFVQGIGGRDGEEGTSSESIKSQIRRLIEEEDTAKPLSDQQLADHLARHGVNISRRTVAKYREEIGIAKSFDRAVR